MPRPKRNYKLVTEKMQYEHGCRVCGHYDTDYAHVVPRTHDKRIVSPWAVVPLCGDFTNNNHHRRFDNHELDLAPYLYQEEIDHATRVLGAYDALFRIRGRGVAESAGSGFVGLGRGSFIHFFGTSLPPPGQDDLGD